MQILKEHLEGCEILKMETGATYEPLKDVLECQSHIRILPSDLLYIFLDSMLPSIHLDHPDTTDNFSHHSYSPVSNLS